MMVMVKRIWSAVLVLAMAVVLLPAKAQAATAMAQRKDFRRIIR